MVGDMTAYFRRRHHLYVPTISEYDTFQFMIGNYVQHYHDAPVIILLISCWEWWIGLVSTYGAWSESILIVISWGEESMSRVTPTISSRYCSGSKNVFSL